MADEVVSQLASGNRVRATRFAVEIISSSDETQLAIFDQQSIEGVHRDGQAVYIRTMDGKETALDFTSLDDAGVFESALRTIRADLMPNRIETMSRTYQNQEAYSTDAARLAGQGWRVTNVTEHQPSTGCARGCLLGLFALVWKPKPELIVTYERQMT